MKKNNSKDIKEKDINEEIKDNKKEVKDKKDIDYKAIIIWSVFIIACIFFVIFIYNNFFTSSFDNNELKTIIDEKKTQVIYVENSDKNKCKNCSEIKKYLDDKGINYKTFDVNKVSDDEYNKFLKTLNIDKELFGEPAIIYIDNGVMYSNIINIDKKSVVEQFIKDYNLK